jgi:hypothetical protein
MREALRAIEGFCALNALPPRRYERYGSATKYKHALSSRCVRCAVAVKKTLNYA